MPDTVMVSPSVSMQSTAAQKAPVGDIEDSKAASPGGISLVLSSDSEGEIGSPHKEVGSMWDFERKWYKESLSSQSPARAPTDVDVSKCVWAWQPRPMLPFSHAHLVPVVTQWYPCQYPVTVVFVDQHGNITACVAGHKRQQEEDNNNFCTSGTGKPVPKLQVIIDFFMSPH